MKLLNSGILKAKLLANGWYQGCGGYWWHDDFKLCPLSSPKYRLKRRFAYRSVDQGYSLRVAAKRQGLI